jgi:DNA (cytosine-5)-methyltransferase 1
MIKNKHAWLLSDLPDCSNGPKVMTTFSCGGGSSMGYKLAGCNVIAANDIDPEMAYHYKLNLKPKHYFLMPIKDLISKDLPDELYDLDILDGSPPCSSFSIRGSREKVWGKKKHFREGQAEQVLDDLFFDYLDLVEKLKPKVSIAENVKGLIQGNAKGYVKLIIERYRAIGYSPQLFLLNGADCGVPQKRERVFFCAIRNDYFSQNLTLKPSCRWISASEAVCDLGRNLDGLFMVTAGAERHAQAGERPVHCPKKNPSPTLCATNNTIDLISADRKTMKFVWSFAEYKRLGSFPDDYQAKSEKIGKYMIGMSVPPRMTELVTRAVIDHWLKPSTSGTAEKVGDLSN